MTATASLKTRDRDTILQALAAGVVPRTGLAHIQVGRAGEVGALVRDIDRIADGGSAVRFVIGEYGAGKTFFLNLVRLIALERKCVTIHADLAPDRRIHATAGTGQGAVCGGGSQSGDAHQAGRRRARHGRREIHHRMRARRGSHRDGGGGRHRRSARRPSSACRGI
ncbi:MAG: ATP-binding protein [Brevundimonas sp.]|nr:ATP-binding protein [Brevundimonas sp.]